MNKVEYKKTEISNLGHIVSKEGVKVDPQRVGAVKTLKVPKDKAAIHCLVGMMEYLQKFAPHLSQIAGPLNNC